MKKMLILIAAVCMTSVASFAQKIGHINGQEILLAMPERATAEKELQVFAKQFEDELKNLKSQYEALIAEYKQNEKTWPAVIKDTKAAAIQEKERAIYEFQETASSEVSKKEEEMLKPMVEKAQKAIEEVAKENGYTYIFDSSSGVLLYKAGDDILELVKKKLGIPLVAPAPTPAPGQTPAPAPGMVPKNK
jgi:outer membrane protein